MIATPAIADRREGAPDFLYSYEPLHVRHSTFLSGLSEQIHRWFRLTPSFGPELVRHMLREMKVPVGAHVHDPFAGAGTTAIEAALGGWRATCLEINPLLHFVNRTALNWDLNPAQLNASFHLLAERFLASSKQNGFSDLEELGFPKPGIHNVDRWWRVDVLKDLLHLKYAISQESEEKYREFFRLAFAGALVPDLTNVTLGRLQLAFVDKSKSDLNVWRTFEARAQDMISDLTSVLDVSGKGVGKCYLRDATKADSFSDLGSIDAVVTSPPYPNRYSYVWNTRPHLYLLDFIEEAKSASRIDQQTIGGTWGTATSELMKGEVIPLAGVEECLDGVARRIRESDTLMANYVVHYFNRIALHLDAISASLRPGAPLAYVIGNSKIKGEYIESDKILAHLMQERLGAQVALIHRFRRRHSGFDLFESIVYATVP